MAVLSGISSEMQAELPLASRSIPSAFLVRPAESIRTGEQVSLKGSGEPRARAKEPGNEEQVYSVAGGQSWTCRSSELRTDLPSVFMFLVISDIGYLLSL